MALNASDQRGGAARAAMRLAIGMRAAGVDFHMGVQSKRGDQYWVVGGDTALEKVINFGGAELDALPRRLYRNASHAMWSNNWVPGSINSKMSISEYDVVHLHWVGSSFLPIQELRRIYTPIVWTLHDMWAFTGGCHYAGTCLGFEGSCGHCPQLASKRNHDLSSWNLLRKRAALDGKSIRVVSPSRWLADLTQRSAIFRNVPVSVIPNGINLDVYQPVEKTSARRLFNLPQDAWVVLFGAAGGVQDPRKGFGLLCTALGQIEPSLRRNIRLVVFGASEPRVPIDVPVETRFVGSLADDVSLACLYSAADVTVVPSLQENLANTIMESMACGTPVVAFDVGGNPDMIDHRANGWLAAPLNTRGLSEGIVWALSKDLQSRLSQAARHKCEQEFSMTSVVRRYQALYHNLVNPHLFK